MRTVIARFGLALALTSSLGVVSLAAPRAAHAAKAAAPLAKVAKEYLAANGMKARTVKVDLGGAKVTRTFVPVTDASKADFLARFNEKSGALVMQHGNDLEHPVIRFAPDKGLKHPDIWHSAPGEARFSKDVENGFHWLAGPNRYLAFDLGAPMLKSLTQHWTNVTQPENAKSGCMWWLAHAEVKKDLPLPHVLGVKRSAATSNLIKKLMHAGNERVAVVGIHVADLDAFSKLTDQQLLGPPPGGGVLEAVKE